MAVLADATERLENFDPFILDTEMTKSPYYFSIYLQVTPTFEILKNIGRKKARGPKFENFEFRLEKFIVG